MRREEQVERMQMIIAKAWTDETFKQRLLVDATAVLREEGVDLPHGVEVRAVENTDRVFHLVISPRPADGELTESELQGISGGVTYEHLGCVYYRIFKTGTPT